MKKTFVILAFAFIAVIATKAESVSQEQALIQAT